MKIVETSLPGVLLIDKPVMSDDRGSFVEAYNRNQYDHEAGIPPIVQWNVSQSFPNVLRGLHMQPRQGKLVRCVQGWIHDVVVDPSTGQWEAFELSDFPGNQLYVPPGFFHGFCVTDQTAIVCYGCTESYHQPFEASVAWDDPDIGIDWPITEPILSERDAAAGSLREFQAKL